MWHGVWMAVLEIEPAESGSRKSAVAGKSTCLGASISQNIADIGDKKRSPCYKKKLRHSNRSGARRSAENIADVRNLLRYVWIEGLLFERSIQAGAILMKVSSEDLGVEG